MDASTLAPDEYTIKATSVNQEAQGTATFYILEYGTSIRKTTTPATTTASQILTAPPITPSGRQPGGAGTANSGTTGENMMEIFYTLIIGIIVLGTHLEEIVRTTD